MSFIMSNLIRSFIIPALILSLTGVAKAAPDAETAYIQLVLISSSWFSVMLMAAGLHAETGLVRAKNAVVQCARILVYILLLVLCSQ